MRIAGHDAVRIKGTLVVELADGREGALDIDIDVSDPRAFLEVQDHYDEYSHSMLSRVRPLSQTLSIHWPSYLYPLRDEERPPPPLTIRMPT